MAHLPSHHCGAPTKVWGRPIAEEQTKEAGQLLKEELEEGPYQVLAGQIWMLASKV